MLIFRFNTVTYIKPYDQSQSSIKWIRIEDDTVKPCNIANPNTPGSIYLFLLACVGYSRNDYNIEPFVFISIHLFR